MILGDMIFLESLEVRLNGREFVIEAVPVRNNGRLMFRPTIYEGGKPTEEGALRNTSEEAIDSAFSVVRTIVKG